MPSLIELRVGAKRLEWRRRPLTWRGWAPVPSGHGELGFEGSEGLQSAVEQLRRERLAERDRIRVIIDDAIVQFGVVPALQEARDLSEFRTASALRAESSFGWKPGIWSINTAMPPAGERVLVCACRCQDLGEWMKVRNKGSHASPLVANAIYAINGARRQIDDDGRIAVISSTGCVALVCRAGEPRAVAQVRTNDCINWDAAEVRGWLDGESLLDEAWGATNAIALIDVRTWSRPQACVLQ